MSKNDLSYMVVYIYRDVNSRIGGDNGLLNKAPIESKSK